MNTTHRKFFLIISFALLFILPIIGSTLKWGGPPPGYGIFPTQKAAKGLGFSEVYFIFAVSVAVVILAFLLFPRLFGFKKATKDKQLQDTIGSEGQPRVSFPPWFWPSIVILAVSWFLMWWGGGILEPLVHYAFVPLWWSFILVLDGFVYKRNGGISIISSQPATMKIIAVVSCVAWYVFEYLNYFVVANWYYPNNQIFTTFGNIFWYSLSYTVILPSIFEWYTLLQTFKPLSNRYANGPRITFPKSLQVAVFIVGLMLVFGMAYLPFSLFWALWVCPIPVLAPAMSLAGYWTPFTPIKKGNWSPVILIALATIINGFFWEFWNYGSEWFHNDIPINPNYWKYFVPYLDKIHIFSEMPILGYFGYLFFGVTCWVIWLGGAYVFNFSPDFGLDILDWGRRPLQKVS